MGNKAPDVGSPHSPTNFDDLSRYSKKLEKSRSVYLGQDKATSNTPAHKESFKKIQKMLLSISQSYKNGEEYAELITEYLSKVDSHHMVPFYMQLSWLDLNFNYTSVPQMIIDSDKVAKTTVLAGIPSPSKETATSSILSRNDSLEEPAECDKALMQIMVTIEKECLNPEHFVFDMIKMIEEGFVMLYTSEMNTENPESLVKTRNKIVNDLLFLIEFIQQMLQILFDKLLRNKTIPVRILDQQFRRCAERVIFSRAFGFWTMVMTIISLANAHEETYLTKMFQEKKGTKPADFQVDPKFELKLSPRPYGKVIDFLVETFNKFEGEETYSIHDILRQLFQIKAFLEKEVDIYYEEFASASVNCERQIMADDLLDILTYSLVQVGNARLKSYFDFVNYFVTKEIANYSRGTLFLYSLNSAFDYLTSKAGKLKESIILR